MASPVTYEFVDKVPEDYTCTICTSILTDPVLVDCCGQLFCEECLKKWIKRQKTCPHCRNNNFKYIKEVRAARTINSFKIYCPNCSNGCNEIITVKEHLNHLRTCLYETVPCLNNCGMYMLQNEVQNHTANECSKRKINCQYCNEEGIYKHITSTFHTLICPSLPLNCPNNCSKGNIKRKDLSDHQKECPLEPVKCPFSEAGCKQRMLQKDLAAHKASNTSRHLELAMIASISTQRQLQAMTGIAKATQDQLEEVTQKYEIFQHELEAQTKKSQATQEKLDNILVKFNILVSSISKDLAAVDSTVASNIKTVLKKVISMVEYEKQCSIPIISRDFYIARSVSFYIQPGYKMYVTLNAFEECTVYLEKGEFDDTLEWPMTGFEIDIHVKTTENQLQLKHSVTICTDCGHTVERIKGEQIEQVIGEDVGLIESAHTIEIDSLIIFFLKHDICSDA